MVEHGVNIYHGGCHPTARVFELFRKFRRVKRILIGIFESFDFTFFQIEREQGLMRG